MRHAATALLLGLAVAAVGCEQRSEPAPKPLPAGPLFDEQAFFCFAVYYLPAPKTDPLSALAAEVERSFPSFRVVPDIGSPVEGACVAGKLEKDVPASFAVPDLKDLRHFGFGLSQQQAEQLQQSREALILTFHVPRAELWERGRDACALALALAKSTGGLLWDEETRQCFSPEAWAGRRLDHWKGGIPDTSKHVTIHSYRTNGYCRAITLGMAKFALPDVVVNAFAKSKARNVGSLIHVICQRMAEGQAVGEDGAFHIDLSAIEHPGVRQRRLGDLKENATRKADVVVVETDRDEGDPHNMLAEITFVRYQGVNVQARQEALLGTLFGWSDTTHLVTHTEEVLEASRRAKGELAALREAFETGLPVGEYLIVKAPFKTTGGGNEWMWVEVTGWSGPRIRGILQNRPNDVPGLDAGEEVYVKEADVFDYLLHRADGSKEGNETGKLLDRQRQGDDDDGETDDR